MVRLNLIESLHEEDILVDFFKYFDQVITDARHARKNQDPSLKASIRRCLDIFGQFMEQLISFVDVEDDSFQYAMDLLDKHLPAKVAKRLKAHYQKAKEERLEDLAQNPAPKEICFDSRTALRVFQA